MSKTFDSFYADPVAAQASTGGRNRGLLSADEKIICLSELNTVDVEAHWMSSARISYDKFKEFLIGEGWTCRRINKSVELDTDSRWQSDEIWVQPTQQLLLRFSATPAYSTYSSKQSNSVMNDYLAISNEFNEFGWKISNYGVGTIQINDTANHVVTTWELYNPVRNRDAVQEYVHKMVVKMQELTVQKKVESTVGIISHDGNSYYVKTFSLDGKVPAFTNVDEHYGEGFHTFHTKMVERINSETKGLILFHGEPGTGKTQYIRMLLDQLTRSNKSVLYVPPGFSDQLTDPVMIEFISEWVMDEDRDCILLIEDAEPLLETRNGVDGRSTGISNLLNMTDGILNDMLGLMVIATFNTSITKIDSALLRPQRLIARKEFGKISIEQATKLSTALGIELPNIDYPATLAEFYSQKKGQDILIHTVTPERKIGFSK